MNFLPITNYDSSPKAIINPFRDEGYQFPDKMLLAFVMPEVMREFSQEYNAEVLATFPMFSGAIQVFQINWHGETMGVCRSVLGAPAAAQIMEFLIAYGAKQIIAVGSCGVLREIPENSFLIVTEALRDEGTSYHYLPAAPSIQLDSDIIASVQASLRKNSVAAKTVKTWTTDAFFRETPALADQYVAQGFEVVEMECSALAAIARFRRIKFGQILFTADSLANPKAWVARNRGRGAHTMALINALNCLIDL
ncbi:nucleoside phosphorylase [Lactiplantibacillus pentosus]|uniref:nucleoside phosphorylase n=1 Tax=Lactiplantibacillus pentosus TaxID=1589 RepID=UPI00259BF256|nr:nucleoside phosphorylase [Lactiplantibacillus pentosus]WFC03065.1 nucleoside phosphorylase [Lactiplantibacillus pentosus]